MTRKNQEIAAGLSHLRGHGLHKGDPVALPITLTSMYHLPGDPAGFNQYGRFANPTWEAVEAAFAHVENAPTVIFPSGMAAIAAVLFATLKTGDRILIPSDGYYTTRMLAERFLLPMDVTMDTRPTREFCDTGFEDYALVFVETPSNPGLDISDIERASEMARKAGALLAVDNTTMTPYGQRPLDLGADMIVAADTKAPNGHSDVLFGHVASRNETIMSAIRDWRKLAGSIPGPFESWLVLRGLETLELRFDRMCSTAEIIASRLAEHKAIQSVRFPGLPGDTANEVAQKQMQRFGFLIGLTFQTEAAAETFINETPYIQPATSFGGIHTSAERRVRWGDAVSPEFVRLSIGCEPAEELWSAMIETLDGL